MIYDEKWVREHYAKMGKPVPDDVERSMQKVQPVETAPPLSKFDPDEKPRRRKYGNKPTEVDGRMFDSRHEAKVYGELVLHQMAGEIRAVLCQVPFDLPGGVRYVADFVTLENDGTYRVYDAKSCATKANAVYRLKKKQMKNCLGITILEV